MNKVYKVIYSKVKQCNVVVSEIAKSHGRHTKSSVAKKKAALAAATLTLPGLIAVETMPTAEAKENLHSNDFFGVNYQYTENGQTKEYNLSGMKNQKNYLGGGATAQGAITAGMNAQAGKNTITIGDRNATVATESVYVGAKYDADNQVHPDSGKEVVSVGYGSDAAGTGSIAIGFGAAADTFDNAGSGTNPDKTSQSIAIGYNAQAKQNNIAIGANSVATDVASTTVAAITNQVAPKSYVSVGDGKDGSDTQYRRITNVADGAADSDVATIRQLKAATGSGFHFYGTKDTVITAENVQDGVDLNNYNGGGATGEKTVAIGSKVVVTGNRSNSVGYANTVKGTLSDVYGNGNEIDEGTNNAVVLGNSNKVGSNSVAIGTWKKENATNSVFIGGSDVSTTEPSTGGSPFTGWATVTKNPDGTYDMSETNPIREDTSDTSDPSDGEDEGAKRNPFSGNESSWDEEDTESTSASAKAAPVSAFSSNALFSNGPSFSLGDSTGTTIATDTTDSTIDKVTVVGKAADASGVGSAAFGYGAKADKGNIALGYNAQATTEASTAAGYLTNSTAPKSYVSVGDGKADSDTQYRRITNVADGSDAQDAVTVAQLRKTANADASNIGAKLKKADGTAADATDVTANEKAWGTALGTGNISTPADMLVTDTAIKTEVRPTTDGTYVHAGSTTAANLTALDNQVKTNADTITNLSSRDVQYDMNEDGKTVNKGKITLAGGTAGTTITNVKAGTANTDAVNVGQLNTAIQNQTNSLKVNAGWGIDIDKTDGNTISLRRNLGRDMDATDKATLEADATKNALVLGGRVGQGESKGGQTKEKAYGAFGLDSVIVGGANNTVNSNGDAAVVVGGLSNEASAQYSAVLGGNNNDALGKESTVTGGFDNNAYGVHATLTGGSWNKAYGEASSVFGGSLNDVAGKSSVAVGGYGSHVYGTFSVGIAGGSTNADYALAAGNGATVTVENGTAIGYQSTADNAGTIAFGHDKDDVYYTSTWAQKATEKDGHYYDANNQEITKAQYDALINADGTYNDYSQAPTFTANKYTEAGYNRLVKVADGQDDHDVVVMEQLKPYTKTDASNIGKNLKKADGTAADADDLTANENAWGTAIGTGSIADQNGQLVTGGTVYTALQNKADIGMGNITDAGKTVIRDLAKEAVTVIPGNFTTVDTVPQGNATAYRVNVQKGNIASGDGGLVTGGQVYDYIAEHPSGGSGQDINLSGKADISAGNVGSNFTKYSDAAKNDTAKQAEEKKANEKDWGTALGTGNIVAPEGMLITDTAVHNEVRPTSDGTWVKASQTTAQNLTALDTQLGKMSGSAVQYDTVTGGTTVDKTKLTLAGEGGTTISNVKAGEDDTDAVNVKQLKEKIAGVTYTAGTGIDLTNNVISAKLGKHLSVNKTDGNIDVDDTGRIAKDDTNLVTGGTVYDALTGGLEQITVGKNGTDGKDGKDGSIGLNGKDGHNGITTTIIKTEKGETGAPGDITRIVYQNNTNGDGEHTVATLDDGMKYAGDTGDVANVKLDHQLKLSGTTFGADKTRKSYDEKEWTSDNIAVVSNAVDSNGNAVMNLKLAKDLKDLNSSEYTTTAGDKTYTTIINGKGLTIQSSTNGKTTNGPSITENGIDAGNRAITNIGTGIATDDKGNITNDSMKNAANIGDVQTIVDKATKDLTDGKNGLNNKANIDASNIGNNLTVAPIYKKDATTGEEIFGDDGKPIVDEDATKAATEKARTKNKNDWASAIGTNEVKAGNNQLVTSAAVATALKEKADQSYVEEKLKTKADANNVYTKTEVDNRVTSIENTMNDDMAQKANVNASNIDTSKWAEKLGTGSIVKDDKNLVTGGTVYTAISNLKGSSLVQSDGTTLTIGSKDTATKVDISGQDAKGNKTGRVLTGVVSDASDPNSAANVGYVNGITEANSEQIYRDMNMQYNHVENDISRAAAGSNALAALHPMQEFDPDDKAQFAVGYGHYRNANAGAVGAFYQPDENSMVNFGVSFGNGDAGINAGVTFKFGPGGSGHHALTKTQMAKVINTQAKEIEALKQDNADKDKRIDALEQKMAEILARLDKSQAGA